MEKAKPVIAAKPKIDSVKALTKKFENNPATLLTNSEKNNLSILQFSINEDNTIDVSLSCNNKITSINEFQIIYSSEKNKCAVSILQLLFKLSDLLNLKSYIKISDTDKILQWSDLKFIEFSNTPAEDSDKEKSLSDADSDCSDTYGDIENSVNINIEDNTRSKNSNNYQPDLNDICSADEDVSDTYGDVEDVKELSTCGNIQILSSTDKEKINLSKQNVPQLPKRLPPKESLIISKPKKKIIAVSNRDSEDQKVNKRQPNDDESNEDTYGDLDDQTLAPAKDKVKSKALDEKVPIDSLKKIKEQKSNTKLKKALFGVSIGDSDDCKVNKSHPNDEGEGGEDTYGDVDVDHITPAPTKDLASTNLPKKNKEKKSKTNLKMTVFSRFKRNPKDKNKITEPNAKEETDDEEGNDVYGDVDNVEDNISSNSQRVAVNQDLKDRKVSKGHQNNNMTKKIGVEEESENDETYGDVEDVNGDDKSSGCGTDRSKTSTADKEMKRSAGEKSDSKPDKKTFGLFHRIPKKPTKNVVPNEKEKEENDDDEEETYGDVDENVSNSANESAPQRKENKVEQKKIMMSSAKKCEDRKGQSNQKLNVEEAEEEDGDAVYGDVDDVEDQCESKSGRKISDSAVDKDSVKSDDSTAMKLTSLTLHSKNKEKNNKAPKQKKKIFHFFTRNPKESNKDARPTEKVANDDGDDEDADSVYGDVDDAEQNSCNKEKNKFENSRKGPLVNLDCESRRLNVNKTESNDKFSVEEEEEGGIDTYGDISDSVSQSETATMKTSPLNMNLKIIDSKHDADKKSIAKPSKKKSSTSNVKEKESEAEFENCGVYGDVADEESTITEDRDVKSKTLAKKSKGFLDIFKRTADPTYSGVKPSETNPSSNNSDETVVIEKEMPKKGDSKEETMKNSSGEDNCGGGVKAQKKSDNECSKLDVEQSQEPIKLAKAAAKKAKKLRMPNASEKKAITWSGEEENLGTLIASHEYKPTAGSSELFLSPGDEIEIWREDEDGVLVARKLKDSSWGFVDECYLEGDKDFLTKNVYN